MIFSHAYRYGTVPVFGVFYNSHYVHSTSHIVRHVLHSFTAARSLAAAETASFSFAFASSRASSS